MKEKLKRWLVGECSPVTFRTVRPASRDPAMEDQIRSAHAALVGEIMKAERRSWEIRQELAGNVISIVSGETP